MNIPIPPRAQPIAVRLWQLLGSMSFAVAMLFVVAVAASVGSLVDQNQTYASYVTNFGTLWSDVYLTLGLDDVYHTPWFLLLLAALTSSTALCVWRNTPMMWREWRSYKADRSMERTNRGSEQWAQFPVPRGMNDGAFVRRCKEVAARAGYRFVEGSAGDISAKRGLERRLGYILAHAAIVVLCLGGLVDGNLPMKWNLARGTLQLETRDVPAAMAGARSRLAADGGSYRGALRLVDGQADDLVTVNHGDGFLVRKLPFKLRLVSFRTEYHPSGQPRDFVSDVELLDPDKGQVLKKMRLSVNHPGDYDGVSLFQSGFDDGGTSFQATVMAGDATRGDRIAGTVGSAVPLLHAGEGLTLEVRSFHPKNVVPDEAFGAATLSGEFLTGTRQASRVDLGRSLILGLRDAAGQAREFTSFLDPVVLEGRRYFVTALEVPGAARTQYLRFPLDTAGSMDDYRQLLDTLRDPAQRDGIAGRLAHDVKADRGAQVIQGSLSHGYETLFDKGLTSLAHERAQAAGLTESQLETAQQTVFALMVRAALVAYTDAHPQADEGTALRFCTDSLLAYSAWVEAGRPPLIHVDAVTPRSASVLQVTHSPGRIAVFAGMVMLVAGVALLVLVQERRLWIRRAQPEGDVVVVLASNRPSTLLEGELQAIVAQLAAPGAAGGPIQQGRDHD